MSVFFLRDEQRILNAWTESASSDQLLADAGISHTVSTLEECVTCNMLADVEFFDTERQWNPSCGHVCLEHLKTRLQDLVLQGSVLLNCGICSIRHSYDMVFFGEKVLNEATRLQYESTVAGSYFTSQVCFTISLSYQFVIVLCICSKYFFDISDYSFVIVHHPFAPWHLRRPRTSQPTVLLVTPGSVHNASRHHPIDLLHSAQI